MECNMNYLYIKENKTKTKMRWAVVNDWREVIAKGEVDIANSNDVKSKVIDLSSNFNPKRIIRLLH